MNAYQTKITAPWLRGAVPRGRLFRLLDELHDYPVTWVSSPAGAGKTTLVASYLKERGLPTLWYRVDESESDVASFFYHMGEAAKGLRKGRKKPLPLFTPAYRLGMAAFARHYFESLFARLTRPGAIVFDNYQDAPEDAEFQEVLRSGLKLVPEGIRVFVVSRRELPPHLVSLMAESALTHVGWEDIRFTVDETREIISRRRKGPVSEEHVRRIHQAAQGWAAAMILMLGSKEMPSATMGRVDQSAVFDYLAVEVFRKLDDHTREFLFQTALLPAISPEIASALTGVEASDAILVGLYRNHYFTDRHGEEYRFHPLFRGFLLDQARRTHGPDKLLSLGIRAGQILAQSGQTEEATRLFLDAGAYDQALVLMCKDAPKLLGQGRSATLEEWAERLPPAMRGSAPWLNYWLGLGQLMTDPTESRRLLEQAFQVFQSLGDRLGCLLSAAGIVNSIVLEWDDYTPLDPWIEWIDRNVDVHAPLSPPDVEAHVSSAMVCGLTWRRPWHPNMKAWVQRAVVVSRQVEDPMIRCATKGHVIEYYTYTGNWREMQIISEELRQIAPSPLESPLVHLTWMTRVVQIYYWLQDYFEDALKGLQKAVRLAETYGAYVHLSMIYVSGVVLAFDMENLDLAKEFLGRVERAVVPGKRLSVSRFLCLRAFLHLGQGNLIQAQRDADNALTAVIETGRPFSEASIRLLAAYVLRLRGERQGARNELRRVEEILDPLGTTYYHYLVRLTQAGLCFDDGDEIEGARALREAFRIGRTIGYAFTVFWWWQPRELARLCGKALANNIEVEYAREVIEKHRLAPCGRLEDLIGWPWSYRIYTLGRFEIIVNDRPLEFVGKVQRRPLALLKALTTLGGRAIRQEAIEDLLWPEAAGDAAHNAFKTTLARLRRLLGSDQVVEIKDGRVSLNPGCVWLDTWALDSLAERVSQSRVARQLTSGEEAERLAFLALRLYQGEFMGPDDEPWMSLLRNQWRKKFLRIVEKIADMFIEVDEREAAVRLTEAVVERGIAPEELRSSVSRLSSVPLR